MAKKEKEEKESIRDRKGTFRDARTTTNAERDSTILGNWQLAAKKVDLKARFGSVSVDRKLANCTPLASVYQEGKSWWLIHPFFLPFLFFPPSFPPSLLSLILSHPSSSFLPFFLPLFPVESQEIFPPPLLFATQFCSQRKKERSENSASVLGC